MPLQRAAFAVAASTLAAIGPAPDTRGSWWREDRLFQMIAARLDAVAAIDNHTHLLWPEAFDARVDPFLPLQLRSTRAEIAAMLVERFGVPAGTPFDKALELARADRRRRLAGGAAAYWGDHLDFTRTEVVLVNQWTPEGADGERLRWVPFASALLFPLPAESLMARNPAARKDIAELAGRLSGWLAEAGLTAAPADLAGYLGFVDRTLAGWKRQGAVAVKFDDAYRRTLRFEDVPEERARRLYAEGRRRALGRDEYLALQDHVARHVFLKAGELKLPVHVHSSHGVPPFLQLHEADVRNLEVVLADPRFFGTQFVLVHGGIPLVEEAAYLAIKPHVWVDLSAQPLLYPVPDLAAMLRIYLLFAPEKVLFGTDPSNYPTVPVGPEVQHAVASRALREALYLALAGLVRDGVVDEERALRIGRGVLRDNARRLYGWDR